MSSWKLNLVRGAFRVSQAVSRDAAAWLADRLFCTPPRSRVPLSARRIMAAGRRGWTLVDGRRVAVWRWGEGPAVALVHGWGSRAGRLAVFVEPLLRQGFSVVAFDAPAHGESAGWLGSGLQEARALKAIDAATPLYGVVGHSLGAAATILALRDGLNLHRAVFIAPPAALYMFADQFAAIVGLEPGTREAMVRIMERRLKFSWHDLDFAALTSGFHGSDLLVIHDRDDAEVPWDNGVRLAASWPGAQLVTTSGLGHHRIARDPGTVERAAQFLAAGKPPGQLGGLWLDRDLFERGRRHRAVAL